MSEHEIERFLDRACCGVGGSPELRRHLRKELKEHLEEEIEQDIAAGMTREEAVAKAIEEFGDPLVIRDGMQSVHGRRLMSLLIEKSMNWRERTMKTGWKWSFVAHLVLVLTIAAEIFLAAGAMMYVVPSLKCWHEEMNVPMLPYVGGIINAAVPLVYGNLWGPCLVVLLAGWGVFEWKCRNEHKSTIRLGALSLISLMAFLAMATLCVPIALDSIVLVGKIHRMHMEMTPEQAERAVSPRVAEAKATFEKLREAISQEDWAAVSESADYLSNVLTALRAEGNATLVLAGENRRDTIVDIRRLFDEIAESSDAIHDRLRPYERSGSEPKDTASLKVKIQTYFDQLERLYAELKQKSNLFAVSKQLNQN